MKKFITIAAMAAFLSLGTATVSAQSTADVIAQLQAQLAALMSGSTVTSESMLSAHTGVNITVGSEGARVMELQACMNTAGYNTGVVDGDYGPNTATGVKAFQLSKGLVADGIVGIATTPAFQAACPINVVVVDEPVEEVEESEFTLGGEGDIIDFEIKSEDDADAASVDQNVSTIEFEVEDGDVVLEKVELYFEEVGVANDLWENIESIQLVVDGEEIADVNVSDDDDWREHDNDIYSISMKGDTVFQDGDKVEIEVMIETTDEVETGDDSEDYNMWAELRFVNGEGISIYEGNDEDEDEDATAFSVVALGDFDLDFDESNDSPEDNGSIDLSGDEEEVLVIVDVEVDENQDGTLEEAQVDVLVTLPNTATVELDIDELINELRFIVDGDEVDAQDTNATIAFGATTTAAALTFTFDLDDMEVEAEDEFEITIEADLKELDDDSEFIGATIKVEEIRIDGENQEGDNFGATEDESTSYSPTFTATAGLIDVDFTDEPVAFEGTDENEGTIVFTVRIENNTGSDLTDMDLLANWNFEVEGYSLDGNADLIFDESGAAAVAIIADGDDEEYEITLSYDKVSSRDFTVEIEELGAEEVPVAVVWED